MSLVRVRDRITLACESVGRDDAEIDLVVVSKNQSDAAVRSVFDQGERLFAENREQGLKGRISSDLPPAIKWHFVGPLQSRKATYVGAHTALLHSMDRMSLAARWAQRSTAPVLIQFNLGAEPQKSGFAPNDADKVIDELLALGIKVQGVMAIPPRSDTPEQAKPWFANLRTIFDRYADRYAFVTTCSMGMSDDLEMAIAEGATMVRVGRAIFA